MRPLNACTISNSILATFKCANATALTRESRPQLANESAIFVMDNCVMYHDDSCMLNMNVISFGVSFLKNRLTPCHVVVIKMTVTCMSCFFLHILVHLRGRFYRLIQPCNYIERTTCT